MACPDVGPAPPTRNRWDRIRPTGDSLYGCADLLGSVWEWTSTRTRNRAGTLRFGHPYRTDDGREESNIHDPRVLMGGSFAERAQVLNCGLERELEPLRAGDTGFRVCVSA